MKRSGYHRVTLEIPQEFKVIFDRLCKKQEMSPREMFCVMVAYYDEHEGQVEEEETEELRD